MRNILIISFLLIFFIGNSQEFEKKDIIGSWTVIWSGIIHPTICAPYQSPTKNTGQRIEFFESGQFKVYPEKLRQGSKKITTGLWNLTLEKKMNLTVESNEITLKVKLINGKLYLSNSIAGIELERK